jgi:centrosomal protein CEP120
MSTEKVLVVVTVFEGRKFLCCSDASLVIDGVIDGYTLSTDAIPLTALQLNLQTELAWEMDRKTLHQHKLRHTPIKLQVFTVDNATCTRKCMGYVLLHLRTANPLGKGLPLWHKLLNAQVQGSPPELFLSLCVEEKIEEKHSTSKDLDDALILHPSGEHYSFGSPSEKMHLFVISVTLDNPSGLPESLSPYYYNYNLLDVDIASEQFVYNEFKTEKASIRILCSRERLRKLLSLKQRMKITLCQSDQFLGKGSLSLKPLLTDDVLKCKVEMGIESGIATSK